MADVFPVAVARDLRLIEAHPSVTAVSARLVEGTKIVLASVEIKTEMPAEWRTVGQSPSGVRVLERVCFTFGAGYPVYAPDIRLRKDFPRNHPHLQPGSAEELPEPCLFAGSPRELLRLRGIFGLTDQLVEWLDKAATLQLIDPNQGWEPVRRDHIDDVIVSDAQWLRDLVSDDAGCSAFPVRYIANISKSGEISYWVTLRQCDPIAIGPALSSEFTFTDLESARKGSGIGLVAWSGKKPNGTPFVADQYLPETVTSVSDLLARAQILGCREYLEPKLTLLQTRVRESKMKVAVPLAVMMLARRPYRLIGSDSVYELCPYVVELDGGDDLSKGSAKKVRPAAHREDISPALLTRAAGFADAKPLCWSLLGCGSVGSKIAVHLAREGSGPKSIIDSAYMVPHNFARHGTYPSTTTRNFGLLDTKTSLLGSALAALAQKVDQHCVDVVEHMCDYRSLTELVPGDSAVILNTTGSATVRETLAARDFSGDRPRVVEACLMGAGKVAVMTVEGPTANPSTTDLICECYKELYERQDIAVDVFGTQATAVAVGQGCSAFTLPLADARLSMFSATLAERFSRYLRQGLPADSGSVLFGHLESDGLSQNWNEVQVAPRIVVGHGRGEIRISPTVDKTICDEIARKPNSETGGIIYGRYCDITDTFLIVGTLPAPPDSKFSKDEFVLGTEGLKPMLKTLIEGSGGALYPLGTWHNHLIASGPSGKDMRTGILLSSMQYFPLLMLIKIPETYTALSVEMIRAIGGASDAPSEQL